MLRLNFIHKEIAFDYFVTAGITFLFFFFFFKLTKLYFCLIQTLEMEVLYDIGDGQHLKKQKSKSSIEKSFVLISGVNYFYKVVELLNLVSNLPTFQASMYSCRSEELWLYV